MMVTLRLYRQHDLDLITLYRHPNFSLPNAMKTSLCAYVRNESFQIKQPEPYKIGEEKISKIVQMHIQLSEKTEGDVIAWLKNIKEGYRNSVLKNVIRAYISGPCTYSYIKDTESGIKHSTLILNEFENNSKELIEVKGRGYQRTKTKKFDNRKVEDSVLAKEILSNDTKPKKQNNVFVERIDDNDVDVKELEKITKKEEERPQPKEQEQQDTSAITLDDMLDDIDKMMDDF